MPPEATLNALEDLLGELFNAEELRRFIGRLDGGAKLVAALDGEVATAETLFHKAVRVLYRRGEIDEAFFKALVGERKKKAAKIREVAVACGTQPQPVPDVADAVSTSMPKGALPLITSGGELVELVVGAYAFHFDIYDTASDADIDLIGALFQHCQDVEMIWDDLPIVDRLKYKSATDMRLREVEAHGWFLFGAQSVGPVQIREARQETWPTATVIAAKADHPRVQMSDGLKRLLAAVAEDTAAEVPSPAIEADSTKKTLKREGRNTAVRVFLSYSHDSPAHDQAVRDLADRLRADGIDARIDQYVAAPTEGWPRWMTSQVEESRFIVLVCTETFKRRFDGKEMPGTGKGGTWEGLLANQVLYDAGTINEKLIPVLLDGASDAHIPLALKPYTHYRLPAGYDALYRHLTGQPAITAPPLGAVRAMPPVTRSSALPTQPVVSAGLPSTPPAGTQNIINHGPVGQQINLQGGSHTFNLGTPSSPRAAETTRMKILFLAANPSDTGRLALDKEIRGIRERLQMSELRGRFELVSAWAVRTGDLRQELLTHKPAIVHFAGHGTPEGLILEGQNGARQRVPSSALASLFGLFTDHVQCVVLNACYSDDQAEAIAQQIPVVVGMKGPVDDHAGVLFADGLYQAIGHDRTIKDAVALGRSAYELEGITETAKPQIRTKAGVNAATYVIRPPV